MSLDTSGTTPTAVPDITLPTPAPEPAHPMDPTIDVQNNTLTMPQEQPPAAAPAPRRRGRRPAGGDTRGPILASAPKLFAAKGYDGVSLRAIARDADVDPALLHHYFKGKPQLFVQAMAEVSADPAATMVAVREAPRELAARALVLNFLAMWDDPQRRSAFPAMVGLAIESTAPTNPFQQFLQHEVLNRLPVQDEDPAVAQLRAQLVASTMLGVALSRYVVKLPEFTRAAPEELADWLAPTLERYLWGPRPEAARP